MNILFSRNCGTFLTTILAVLVILIGSNFTNQRAWADTGGSASVGAVHALLTNSDMLDNGTNIGTQLTAAHSARTGSYKLHSQNCPAPAPYVNPFHLTVAIGGTVQGYHEGWTNACPTVEVCPTYSNFLGLPVNLIGSVRYCNFTGQSGGSDYWKSKSQWTIGAEAPLGGGATLFTRYENHFLVNDDWFFGGIRLALN